MNFYKYVVETYSSEQSPKGDFANDMKKILIFTYRI